MADVVRVTPVSLDEAIPGGGDDAQRVRAGSPLTPGLRYLTE